MISGSSRAEKYSQGRRGSPVALKASKYSFGYPARPVLLRASQSSVLPLRGVAQVRYEQVRCTLTSSMRMSGKGIEHASWDARAIRCLFVYDTYMGSASDKRSC